MGSYRDHTVQARYSGSNEHNQTTPRLPVIPSPESFWGREWREAGQAATWTGRPEVERMGSERIKFLEQFQRCLDFARHDKPCSRCSVDGATRASHSRQRHGSHSEATTAISVRRVAWPGIPAFCDIRPGGIPN